MTKSCAATAMACSQFASDAQNLLGAMLGVLALSGCGAQRQPAAAMSAAASARHNGPDNQPAVASVQSDLRAPGKPARRFRPGRRRPGPRRPDQARRRRHRQAAGGPRSRRRASAQGRLRRRGIFCAVLGAVAAMRADHFADPADARQPRPHDERSRTAQERQQRSGRPAPRPDRTIGAK